MSAPELSAMPATFAAGTSVKYTRSLSDYSAADSWVLKLYLAGVSVTDAITGTVNGSTWNLALSPATTAKLKPGTYQWQERVSKSGDEYVAASGVVVITPNIATALAGGMQTHAERMLAAIEALLENRIPADVNSYMIAGRSITRMEPAELREFRAQYAAEVAAQKNPGGFGRTVFGKFVVE